MSRRHKPKMGTIIYKTPLRGEIWLAVDRDKKHNGKESEREFDDHVQAGTRTCIIVSNNTGNMHSPNVEVVYTTTKQKTQLPTHFFTESTPEPSTVQCEAVDTVSRKTSQNIMGRLRRVRSKNSTNACVYRLTCKITVT